MVKQGRRAGPAQVSGQLDQPMVQHRVGNLEEAGDVGTIHVVSRRVIAFGRLDALLNNAGIASMNHALLTPASTVEQVFQTNVIGTFVFSGVFERYPDLRVAFFECSAEWILYWMHRMDDDYGRLEGTFTPKITRMPSEYLKKNCYVTCEADERLLALALTEFNEDRVMMASDYPHFDSEYPGTVRELQERTDITDKQK